MSGHVSIPDYGSGMSLRQFAAHCEARLRQSAEKEELFRQMVKAGCPPAEATRMIDAATTKLHGEARRTLCLGIALFLLGALISVVTYRTAYEAGGGTYLLCYGAVISGIICIIIGIRSIRRLR